MADKWYDGLPGIDAEVGIKNSSDESVFKTLVTIFYETIDEVHDELCDYFREENWKDYTVKVHSLKSTALLIGAKALGDEALELEMAGKREDIDYIKSNHDSLMDHLKSFEEPLSKALGSGDGEEPQGGNDFDRFLIESIYEALSDGANDHDDVMIAETFEEASEYTFPSADAERLERLKECYAQKDYSGMINIIDGI